MSTLNQVLLKPFYGKIFLNNGIFSINNGYNILFNFKKKILKQGIALNTIDRGTKSSVSKYVYCDAPYPWELSAWLRVVQNRRKNTLFCFESPLVNPFSHMRLIHLFFPKVYTWDDSVIDNRKYKKLYIPQLNEGLKTKSVKFEDKKLLVFVNAKKSAISIFRLLSPYKTDLYKEREKAIDFFNSTVPDEFSFYGHGWGPSEKYSSYKGVIRGKNKIKVMSGFKFCVCFENTQAPGYLTEKIFDCFKARCVPIYLGDPNVNRHIPQNCFIDFRNFKSYQKLLHFLESITETDYNSYVENIEGFLADKHSRTVWFEEGFERTFLEAVS